MTPSFDFSFGKTLEDEAGRWIHGNVARKADGSGYRFKADLWRRYSSSRVQCHPVRLYVDRPFRAGDFAAYLRKVSSGEFETGSHVLGLYETQGLDPAGASAIFEAAAVWVDPCDHSCLALLQDLVSLGEQLEQVRKRELLGMALARFS